MLRQEKKANRRNNSRSYNIKDFLNRPLSRLRNISRIIRDYLRDLILFVIEIRVYFYLYLSINS